MGILRGKLIKKDDNKAIKKLDLQAYPWLSFQEKDLVFPDNPRKSVILNKYHDPKELREKVQPAKQFFEYLEQKPTPLYPVDLTKDYHIGIQELIKRKRRRLMGEEEAMALELAEIDTSSYSSHFKVKIKEESEFEKQNNERQSAIMEEEKIQPPSESKPQILPEKKMEPILKFEDPPEQKMEPVQKIEPVQKMESIVHEDLEIEKKSSINSILNEEEIQKKQKEGYELGYLEGFKSGEEVGLKSQESKYETVFQNIAGVVEQIEKLKNSLYMESKDVFIEIIKLCSEKVLRHQIKYSDESLYALFDEVVKNLSQKVSMKIELNSEDKIRMLKHIEKLGMQDRVTLKEDNTKASGDFTLDSERGISLVSLQKTIENLIDKLKPELFSEDETDDDNKKVS